MSQKEMHKGKIRKVELHGKTVEEFCKEHLNKNGVLELSAYSETWIDEFREREYEKYFFINKTGEVYELIEHEEIGEDLDVFEREANGDISFVTSFYNGGTCLSERIDDSVSKMPTIEETGAPEMEAKTMPDKINDGGAAFPTEKYDKWIEQNVYSPKYQCTYWTEEMAKAFPELRRVRGYYVEGNGSSTPHWWMVDPMGNVVDPTVAQFRNYGVYEPLDESLKHRTGRCVNCGGDCFTQEPFCSDECSKNCLEQAARRK